MLFGLWLVRWYGIFNLCKLFYVNKIDVFKNGVLDDFKDGKLFYLWFEFG